MTYSVVKVEGLSMKPFLITSDLVVVSDKSVEIESLKKGSCLNISNNVHRLVSSYHTKGDRLVYNDSFNLSTSTQKLVVGRIIKKNHQLTVSDYQHPVLLFISNLISFFSSKNKDSRNLRLCSLFFIILFSKLHRSLEKHFTLSLDRL
jgi:signal peptidase I